jgi:type VI secretion system secreted protein VgrG
MATSITQKGRILRLGTPLGEDIMLAEHLSGIEGLSQPFHFEVSCLVDVKAGNLAKVDPKKLLGAAATVDVLAAGEKPRLIHGIIRRFRAGPVDEAFARFDLELVPTLALLDLTSDCRIFQNQSVPDIVQKVLKEGGVTVKSSLTKTYTTLDHCVQYRETDFNFISRLLEQEGIFYYFEHAASGHTMVLADQLRNAPANPVQDKVEYGNDGDITLWEERRELFTGKFTMRDYHFETPRATLESTTPALKPADAVKSFETFDFAGEYAQRFNKPGERMGSVASEGERLGKIRMEEAEAAGVHVDGTSRCAAFMAGHKFTVTSLGNQHVKGSWVLKSVRMDCAQHPGYVGEEAAAGSAYSNRFSCVPADAVFRPARVTPKPVIAGPHSARVVDESSSGDTEEIFPDKYGRVRVRFPWDRENKSAAWVRVAQQRAGKSGGFIWIPRVGDEVLVAFLEGDPDCPVIVGSVYNADNMPPYQLPANKTQSGIKSRSSAQGGAGNVNEFRFEDKKGSEQLYVHAEKDLDVVVKHDETRAVQHDRKIVVDNDQTVTIKHDDTLEVTNDQTVTVKGKQTTTIEKDHAITVKSGNQSWSIDQGNHSTKIKLGNQETELATGNQKLTLKMGNQDVALKLGNQTTKLDVGNVKTECTVGNITMKCAAGKVTIEALQGIELKVGPNSIKIDMSGIQISGLQVKSEGQIQNSMEGLMCKVEGKAMLQAKGALTMIG